MKHASLRWCEVIVDLKPACKSSSVILGFLPPDEEYILYGTGLKPKK